MRTRHPRSARFLFAAIAFGAGGAAHAQVRFVASGQVHVEGRLVALLQGAPVVPLPRSEWTAGGSFEGEFHVEGLAGRGTIRPYAGEYLAQIDRPVDADVGLPFRVVVRARRRVMVYARRGDRTLVGLPGLGMQGVPAPHDEYSADPAHPAAALLGPAGVPHPLLVAALDAGAPAEPDALTCAGLTVYPSPDERGPALTTNAGDAVHVMVQGGWSELWVERPSVLIHGWTRSVEGCTARPAGVRVVPRRPGVCGFGLPPSTLLPGLQFGATAGSHAPWLTVVRPASVHNLLEQDGVTSFQLGAAETGAAEILEAHAFGPAAGDATNTARPR